MSHEHSHGIGHSHSHGVDPEADRRWLTLALTLILGFMAAEVVVGLLAGSLALLSDAAHMLTDAASIILALVALRLAARPARGTYTYGLKRTEILSAQANGLSLLLLGGWLAYEAIRRLLHPPDVEGAAVLITAVVGIGVNIAAAWALSRANRSSLNVQGAFQHILSDLYAFIATAIAGAVAAAIARRVTRRSISWSTALVMTAEPAEGQHHDDRTLHVRPPDAEQKKWAAHATGKAEF